MTALHVVVAGWLLRAGEPSGASRRLVELLRALPPLLQRDERVTVLVRENAAFPDLPAELAVRRLRLPAGPAARRAVAERRTLPGLLRHLGADVLDQSFLPLCRRLPCPAVLTVHDLRDLTRWRRRPPWLARRVLRAAAARADRLVAPSRHVAQALRDVLGPHCPPVAVVPGGVHDQRPWSRSEARTPYVLHVGHLEPRKNLGLLIDAVARCRAAGGRAADLRLVLAGADHGSGRHLDNHARRAGIAAAFDRRGVVSERELARLYAGASVVAVPSWYEGFGLAALEGLAFGRPVLVSDRAALPEVVGNAGVVLPADDPLAWATAIGRALEDPPDEDTVRARAARFSWARAAGALLATWREAAAAHTETRRITR